MSLLWLTKTRCDILQDIVQLQTEMIKTKGIHVKQLNGIPWTPAKIGPSHRQRSHYELDLLPSRGTHFVISAGSLSSTTWNSRAVLWRGS
eukprot:390665-Pyramimonas_sp.AAC.1